MNEHDSNFELIPSFHFVVEIGGERDGERVSFQEVTGLEATLELEEVTEGGNNLFKHRLPVRQSFSNITLIKGVMNEEEEFHAWVSSSLLSQESIDASFGDRVKTIRINLLSLDGAIEVRSWQLVNAYPVKWSTSSLNAGENKIAIDTVELAYQYLTEI